MPPANESEQQRRARLIGVARQAAAAYGLDERVFLAQLIVESGNFTAFQGAAGEIGPGQFMPDTWVGVWRQHPELRQKFGNIGGANGRKNFTANIWAAAAY